MARILIADREPTSLLELEVHLAERGHIVASAESLSEVREKAAWLLPQICICEFELADGTTAPQLCDLLRRMAPATEFIVCTSRPLEYVITLCEAVGMRGHYFKKPGDPETLTWAIEGVVCNAAIPKALSQPKKRHHVRTKSLSDRPLSEVVTRGGSATDLLIS